MRIVLLYTGWKERAHFYTKSLEKYAEVVLVGSQKSPMILETEYNPPNVNWVDINVFNFREEKYDLVLGLDHGCVLLFNLFESVISSKKGCIILDWISHINKRDKNYLPQIAQQWESIISSLPILDFIVCNREEPFNHIKKIVSERPMLLMEYPFLVPSFEKKERQNFITYSGSITPDKGIHYLIDALGLVPDPPKLVIVSLTGGDLKDYAKFLKVPYELKRGISQKEKFELYYQSLFTVSPVDNNICPLLSCFENITIGRGVISFDYPEFRRSFRDCASYVEPLNILYMARKIEYYRKNFKELDNRAKRGIQYYKECWTYEIWASDIYHFLEEEVC